MTITVAQSPVGIAAGRSGPPPGKEQPAGGRAFRDLLGEQPATDAAARDRPGRAGGRHARVDAGSGAGARHEIRHDGDRPDEAGQGQEAPAPRGPLPLLASLHRLSGKEQRDEGAKDAAGEDGDKAADGASGAVPVAGHVAAALADAVAAGGGGESIPEAQPAPARPQVSAASGAELHDAGAEGEPVQLVDAAVRGAAPGQPGQPAGATRRQPTPADRPQPGTATGAAPEPDAADAAGSDGPPEGPLRPHAVRAASAQGEKGAGEGSGQSPQGKAGGHDEMPRGVAVTASQSYAPPVSSPVSQTTAGLVAAIGADNAFRQTVANAAAFPSVAVPTHVLKIELHPAELGSVAASLRMVGEQLSVEIRPQTHEAYHRLSADRDDIARSLKRLGLAVDAVTILQPQMAATPAVRSDAASSATAAPGRDAGSFQPGSPNGDGGGQGGRQPEGNRNDGRQNGAYGAPASRMRAGGGLFI